MRAEIIRYWKNGSRRHCGLQEEPLYPAVPSAGLVIGTFAAVPYIHLQLEARRRFYPSIPILVHDDGSGRQNELRDLCGHYGADFESNAERQPPCVGDITAMSGGLLWAKENRLDLLLKISRRWIFCADWAVDFLRFAQQTQYATFCSYTTSFNFGFRTECIGMSVKAWTNPLIFFELNQPIRSQQSVFVEGYVHNLARKLEAVQSGEAEKWRTSHPMPHERSGYALWEFMGTDRCAPSANFLWHDCNKPTDYARTAVEWGLSYSDGDFADPNQGEGITIRKNNAR